MSTYASILARSRKLVFIGMGMHSMCSHLAHFAQRVETHPSCGRSCRPCLSPAVECHCTCAVTDVFTVVDMFFGLLPGRTIKNNATVNSSEHVLCILQF